MKLRSPQVILIGLLVLSIGINVVQYRNYVKAEERRIQSSVKDQLVRLSINRSLLVDLQNPPSLESQRLLHGSIHMDLIQIQPTIGELSNAYQLRYQEILADLDSFRRTNPNVFAQENLVMDAQMRSQYIDLISAGYTPK